MVNIQLDCCVFTITSTIPHNNILSYNGKTSYGNNHRNILSDKIKAYTLKIQLT